MPRRLTDLEMPTHLCKVLAGGQLLVALGELADDLIRRVPPALAGCHGAAILPALTGNEVAQHLDHYEGLSSNEHLFDNDAHPVEVDGVWPRLLAVIEVALELCDILFDDERDDDGIAVDVFAGAGIMCDITRNVASLEALLPWMGPACLKGARTEVNNHMTSRGYGIDDVDWSNSGVAYRPLAVSVLDLVPARRS
jgi:hypothetical protein